MFDRPSVPQSICPPLYDISPYVSHVPRSLCYPEMFPSPVTPQNYPVPVFPVPQYQCFRYFPIPVFPSPYVPQSLRSPVHLFPSPHIDVHQSLCPPVVMFPQLIHLFLCSPLIFHRSVLHSLYYPTCFPIRISPVPMFPSPYVPPTSSPVPMFCGA